MKLREDSIYICKSNGKLYVITKFVKYKESDSWQYIVEYMPMYECDIPKFYRSKENFKKSFIDVEKFNSKYESKVQKLLYILKEEVDASKNYKFKVSSEFIKSKIRTSLKISNLILLRLHESGFLYKTGSGYFCERSRFYFIGLFK